MEKPTPHYPLARVKHLIEAGAFRVTESALERAARDFLIDSSSDVADRVLRLEQRDFYKSMTSYHDSKLWQDVYHAPIEDRLAYVKVQIFQDRTVVISFTDLEDG